MDAGTAGTLVHSVLFNHDLLHGIFSFLHHPPTPPGHADEDKPGVEEATLARAARVCKTFTDPALAALWDSLPTFLPLWLLLEPLQMLGEQAAPPDQHLKYILTNEISPANWSRFRHYAALIREVRLDDVTDARIDQSVWLHLVARAGGEVTLLPRLRSLSYAVLNPYRTSILLFLSPTLRKLDLCCSWRAANWGPIERQEAAVSMLIRAACTNCPQLDDLKLSMLEFPGPLRVAAEGLKHRLRRLELGTLEVSDAATIQALADISTLEQLREIHVKGLPTQRVPIRGFRALKDLSIVCDAVEDVANLLACVVSPLESLEICSFAPSSSWQEGFGAIVPMVKKSLKSFGIELLPEPTGNQPETLYMLQLVQHLLPLRNLEAFSLLVRDTALIAEDHAFEAMTKAWPRLLSFSLDGGVVTSSATLTTLALFAQNCPALHTLLLPHLTDAVDVPQLDNDALPVPSQGALRRLSFYLMEGMTIRDPHTTARVISRLFPNLDIQGACRMAPFHKPTPADEDEALAEEQEGAREMQRQAGRDAWASVLAVIQQLYMETPSPARKQ
ncbi:hypothetical protein L226DRAFT_573342 [Lentinus tigrinus ALCF2SS1-7]|uniref:F-box domain-containing protein n=1 Tax=Lentinus tigrinus ALCF2SS1-6 TaxID=1328759 RepID=A0A5C2S348_9APHY|nr:hypothetical protein L227DRAFT_655030 [Lentinus tigrinus ALCF2SS1-6]RPD72295.1 hypothetical protein L226DRAFT_573342 [Lentinus tigrinus ALCF2SS1-7]